MILAGLLLLTSLSDDFAALSPIWHAGLRGMPQTEIVANGLALRATSGEPVPYVDDAVRTFTRPVLLAERPFAVYHVWLPPFSEWPTQPNANGTYSYLGLRLTITRTQGGGFTWPGIFVAGGPNGPHFIPRVLIDSVVSRPITQAGWWTLAIGCRQGEDFLSFYAAPGKVALTEADRFFSDPELFPTTVRSFDGWFLQVIESATETPAWTVGAVQLYADIRPTLSIARDGDNVTLTTSGYPGESYPIQRSVDLLSWQSFAGFVDAIVEPSQFYRLTQ